MNVQTLLDTVPDLSDLELAVLVCLIAQQHCLITTVDESIDDLATELALIVSETHSLTYAVLSQEDQISVETFGQAILSEKLFAHEDGPDGSREQSRHPSAAATLSIRATSEVENQHDLDSRLVANVIIGKDFNLAPRDVQVAALELIRNRRIYSRTTVHPVPKIFLFLPLVSTSTSSTRLIHHLNDRIFISHHHNPQDGFPNLEDLTTSTHHSTHSTPQSTISSRSPSPPRHVTHHTQIPHSVITSLHALGTATTLTPEVHRYLHDIIVFLRMDRAVDGGITPLATTSFVALSKFLAPLHHIDFVTPDLVRLAARKVYPHRVVVAAPERERSTQYGSNLEAAREMLDGLTPEDVVENVLRGVPCPV